MEPLYPQNILERTFPHLRELREKEEKESMLRPEDDKSLFEELAGVDVGSESGLYYDVPYEGGNTGKNLSTFA